MEEYYHEWEIREITTKAELSRFINKHADSLKPYEWLLISKCPAFKLEMVDKYLDKIDWEYISCFYNFSEEELRKYIGYYLWYPVSVFAKLSKEFMTEYADKLSLDALCRNDSLGKEELSFAHELKRKYNDPEHHKIWDDNLRNCKIFCPKNFKGNYKDYNLKPLKSKKQKIINKKIDISKLSKAECKELLDKGNIKYLYKDTLQILQNKVKEMLENDKKR